MAVAPTRARQQRQEKRRVARQEAARGAKARATQQHQASAKAGDTGHRRGRHRVAFVLWSVAAVFAVLDLLVYTDALGFMSPAVATFGLGGPMVMLVLVGAVVYGT